MLMFAHHDAPPEAPTRDETASETAERSVAGPVRRFQEADGGFRWEDVPLKHYKPVGNHFRDITRQVLFGEAEALTSQLRYFEVAPDGHSTLERHAHVHAVFILRGRGRVLVGDAVHPVGAFDLVYVPPQTWHQFRADENEGLGFLCLVACDRDRPHRPDDAEAEALRAHPVAGPFIRL